MLLRAFAKINLDLRILGRRDDGYHEICTIFQAIEWWDEIQLEPASGFEFSTSEGPQDETNLVVRAVRAYERLAGVRANVRIRLTKNIPIGRGLGGGSSDAAATFIGLQRIYKRSLPQDELPLVLRDLGSDVRFFTIGGRAVGRGRGDEVEALLDELGYLLVIVDPGIVISTNEAYSWLTVPSKSNTIEGFRPHSVRSCGTEPGDERNDFAVPVFKRYPVLADIQKELLQSGAFRAALSGSGSAMFGQFKSESAAMQAASTLANRFAVKVTKPLPGGEYFQRMIEEFF